MTLPVVWAALVGFLLPWQMRYIFSAPTVGGVPWDFGIIGVYVSQVALATWLVREWWPVRHNIRVSREWWFIAGIAVVQLVVSGQKMLTAQLLFGALLLIGLWRLLRRKPDARTPFLGAFVVSSIMHAMLGFLQTLTDASFASTLLGIAAHHARDAGAAVVLAADGARHLRAYGGQPHPNIFGFQMVVALIVSARLAARYESRITRATITRVSMILAGALALSFSRSALLAFGFVVAVWWLWKKMRGILSPGILSPIVIYRALITVGVLLAVLLPLFFARVVGTNKLEERSVRERLASLHTWKEVFLSHPLLGVGWGAYTTALPGVRTGDARVPVHNAALLVLAEFGVIGCVALFAACWRRLKKIPMLAWCALAPPTLFDHFLVSLWPGMVLGAILIFSLIDDFFEHP